MYVEVIVCNIRVVYFETQCTSIGLCFSRQLSQLNPCNILRQAHRIVQKGGRSVC